jgi:hypothetical protein
MTPVCGSPCAGGSWDRAGGRAERTTRQAWKAAAQNARVVAATASSRAGDHAALISVMTGLAESGMRVLANRNDPAGNQHPNQHPNQGVGNDHDPLGSFQQRGLWGTAAQRMDLVASTNLLLDALLSRPDWNSVELWRAPQDVQRSAFTRHPDGFTSRGITSVPPGSPKMTDSP